MNKTIFLLLVILTISITSCSNKEKKSIDKTALKVEQVKVNDTETQLNNYKIAISESTVKWSGEGVGHGHNGLITIKSGDISLKNGVLSDCNIIIDMHSISITDIDDPKENAKLLKHLKNKDFFNVEKFPTASLSIIGNSEKNSINAKMKIKNSTQDIIVPISVSKSGKTITITSKLTIDRTKFGITYSSGNFFKNLGDYLVEDDIELNISIKAYLK